MAHGVSGVLSEGTPSSLVKMQQKSQQVILQQNVRKSLGAMGSRRIFAPAFKLKVLDSYRNDMDCRGNQRATARKYGIHRRQIQKWLQCEDNLRNSCAESGNNNINSNNLLAPINSNKLVTKHQQDNISCGASGNKVISGPLIVTTTPAAPALNLSLARLHGDELATQQASEPPPLSQLHHQHSHGPSSPQSINIDNSTLINDHLIINPSTTTNYNNYQIPNRESENGNEDKYYNSKSIDSPQRYSSENQKVYQCLTNYHSIHPSDSPRYNNKNEMLGTSHCSPNERERSDPSTIDSDKRNKTVYINGNNELLLAPPMIKSEQTSPDLVATTTTTTTTTTGMYEQARSPSSRLSSPYIDSSWSSLELSYDGCRTITNLNNLQNNENSSSCTSSSPSHVYVHQNLHSTLDLAKKLIAFQQKTEKDVEEDDDMEINANNKDKLKIDAEMEQQPTSSTIIQDQNLYFTSPSSPSISSGTSSSSCSDNELDSFACTCNGHTTNNDLNRRRSFSLRFKLDVLDVFHQDPTVAGNQRATARKFGINRRQVQKWLGQELELRGEIALRGNSRQRLGPTQDIQDQPDDHNPPNSTEALDLTTTPIGDSKSMYSNYYCDSTGSLSQSQHQYYNNNTESLETESSTCILSCCTSPNQPCYPESRGFSDQTSYCYSPKSSEISSPETNVSTLLKRSNCSFSCCYESPPSKRLCLDMETTRIISCPFEEMPPQEMPLCLVKSERISNKEREEPVTSTVPTPPIIPTTTPALKKDAILFKPYLDNPLVSKTPTVKKQQAISPNSPRNINNNNCQSICNLNDGGINNNHHDYNLEFSLKVPVSCISWSSQPNHYVDFPHIRSAFVRYPTSTPFI